MAATQFIPVILAGGSGTRFWPLSRRARAKQVLALDGDRTMIQQTLERLLPVADDRYVWVITNSQLAAVIGKQLPEVPSDRILTEPIARNTAPACGLAAFLVARTHPNAVIGIFPSDHVVQSPSRFQEVIRAGTALAASGDKIVVLGVPPTRPETGYGYIEMGEQLAGGGNVPVRRVRRFTEKPDLRRAEQFVQSGHYAWNSGIFLWSAKTLANAIREHQPEMAPLLEKIAAAQGTPAFNDIFAELYPQCENISVDYALMEPRSARGEAKAEIYCLPGDFGWNDLGSWAALEEHLAPHSADAQSNVLLAGTRVLLDAHRNFVYAPGKAVALVGVSDLIVVETEDAILVTTLSRSQDVGKVVGKLIEDGKENLI